MAKKLFIGGLSWNTTDESLRAKFEEFGEVTDAVVIREKDTGRSRGFGFVEFSNGDDADAATREMHDQELDGRTIRVTEAAARRPRGGGGGGGGGRGGYRGGNGGGGGYNGGGGGGYNNDRGGYNGGGGGGGGDRGRGRGRGRGGYRDDDNDRW